MEWEMYGMGTEEEVYLGATGKVGGYESFRGGVGNEVYLMVDSETIKSKSCKYCVLLITLF